MSPATSRAPGKFSAIKALSLRAFKTSRAPRPDNSRAHAAPMPPDAPVITTTCSRHENALMPVPVKIAKLPPPSAKRNNTIMSKLLPLFPLQLVVFPRTQVPLHIFEERYKLMVNQSLAGGSEFGIVLAQGQGIVKAGCTVRIQSVITQYEDGRLDILTLGARRFEILDLNQDQAYLQGQVEFFDDETSDLVPASLRKEAVAAFHAWVESRRVESAGEPDLGDAQLSFQLAQSVPDLAFQSVLLRDRSELSRLQQLVAYFEQQLPREEQVTRMKHLAPMNGFGAKPAGV